MATPYYKIDINDELNQYQMKEILRIIAIGGVCLIPSDTGYSLATVPYNQSNVDNLRKLLPHAKNSPISLCFANRDMAEKYVVLKAKDHRTFDTFGYSPITLICELQNSKIQTRLKPIIDRLYTLGVRISDSPVERQISAVVKIPITTCAVRDKEGNIVQDFDAAVEYLKEQMKVLKEIIPLATIKIKKIKYQEHSTILSFLGAEVKILREGMIESKDIIKNAKGITRFDTLDWT